MWGMGSPSALVSRALASWCWFQAERRVRVAPSERDRSSDELVRLVESGVDGFDGQDRQTLQGVERHQFGCGVFQQGREDQLGGGTAVDDQPCSGIDGDRSGALHHDPPFVGTVQSGVVAIEHPGESVLVDDPGERQGALRSVAVLPRRCHLDHGLRRVRLEGAAEYGSFIQVEADRSGDEVEASSRHVHPDGPVGEAGLQVHQCRQGALLSCRQFAGDVRVAGRRLRCIAVGSFHQQDDHHHHGYQPKRGKTYAKRLFRHVNEALPRAILVLGQDISSHLRRSSTLLATALYPVLLSGRRQRKLTVAGGSLVAFSTRTEA